MCAPRQAGGGHFARNAPLIDGNVRTIKRDHMPVNFQLVAPFQPVGDPSTAIETGEPPGERLLTEIPRMAQ
jgi:hypothetical protein